MRRDAPAVSKLGKGFYTNPAGEAVTEAGGKRGRSPMSAERKTGMPALRTGQYCGVTVLSGVV